MAQLLGELTEGSLAFWSTFAPVDGAIATVSLDTTYVKVGQRSLKFVTQSGFDTGIAYSAPLGSFWDISPNNYLMFWAYAINDNFYGFQGNQPIIDLITPTGTIRYEPQGTFMTNETWRQYAIPLAGDAQWVRTTTGTPDLTKLTRIELHQDTWDTGFTVYYDGLKFVSRNPDSLPPAGPPPPPGVNPDAIQPKVLLYVFDPIMENFGGQRQHTVYGWDDPVSLTQQVVNDLKKSSHNLVNYQVVETKIVDKHPYFVDGFQHTDASFAQAWSIRDFHNSTFDYARFVAENNIAPRIEQGEIDEVWIYAGPIGGLYESAMAGKGAYWINGMAPDIPSDRAFVIMGWNFERGVGEAIHSYGHRAESIMDHIYGTQASNLNNNWNKFTFQDRYQSGQGGVGNIHFPVNGTSHYDYYNPRFVLSNADDWYNYPNFKGTTRSFNSSEWSPSGSDPQREYLNWWYDHLPHFNGRGKDYYLNNWWRYITDVDQFKASNGNLVLTDGIPTVAIANVTDRSGSVKVTASAAVDGALGRVDLYVDGTYVSSDTLSPYTFTRTLGTLSGTHTLVAKAYELQNGTEAISQPVTLSTVTTTLSTSINNLYLLGANAVNGTGNQNNNVITGNSSNNILNGKAGDDTLTGGNGNDTYIVDKVGDRTIEATNGGTDSIEAAISWTLSNHVEKLILATSNNINGTGNNLNNVITGNSGNNVLKGGDGADTLSGGSGNDQFIGGSGADSLTGGPGVDRFTFYNRSEGVDRITDFSTTDDTIEVSKAGFVGGLTAGAVITSAQFYIGSAARDSSDRFIYNRTTGGLFFDADGKGGIAQVQIATLSTKPSLTRSDIFVIS